MVSHHIKNVFVLVSITFIITIALFGFIPTCTKSGNHKKLPINCVGQLDDHFLNFPRGVCSKRKGKVTAHTKMRPLSDFCLNI